MGEARAAWHRWVSERLVDGVVDELVELPAWALGSPNEAKAVLGVLASMTETEKDAITVLVWALLPGAARVARPWASDDPDRDRLTRPAHRRSPRERLARPGVVKPVGPTAEREVPRTHD